MSTTMYAYRCGKDDWWDTAERIRAAYLAGYGPLGKMREIIEAAEPHLPPLSDRVARRAYRSQVAGELAALLKDFTAGSEDRDDWTVRLQLFDEGDTLLLRPLEHGDFFGEHADAFNVAPVFYDSSTDDHPEWAVNAPVAAWMDRQILDGRYLTYQVVSRNDFGRAISRWVDADWGHPDPI